MVALFLGLKLRIMAGAFRRSPWQIVGMVIGVLYGLFLALLVVAALVASRFIGELSLIHDIVIVGGSAVFFGFLVFPLIFGVDDTLDPRRFSLFGIPTRRLAAGLLLAALIGIPSVVLALGAAATIVTWSQNVGTVLFAVVAAAAAILSCVLGARVTTSVGAFLLSTRRSREIGGVIGVLLIVMISPAVIMITRVDWAREGIDVLAGLAAWLGWSPLGAVWAVPAEAAIGAWGSAILRLLIALATLAALWLAWETLVAKMLVTPGREARAKSYSGLGWFERLPYGPAGAIAARGLSYWARDARYWISLIMIPLMPVIAVIALSVAGVPGEFVSLLPLPVMCLFLGWSMHNDVAYDGTAIWLHVASGTRGIHDRIGRLVPVVVVGVPLLVVGSVVTGIAHGDWSVLPAVVGVGVALLFSGLGLSSVFSALLPYPATRPGDSPFTQPQNTGATAALIQSVSFFAVMVWSGPAIAFGVLGLMFGTEGWFMTSLVVGVAMGTLALVGGVLIGSRVFDRRGPELMSLAARNA